MTLKTALVAPIPSARESTAVRVNPGRLRNSHAAKCKSDATERMIYIRLQNIAEVSLKNENFPSGLVKKANSSGS